MTAKQAVSAMLKETGWNPYQLAQASGVPLSTISRVLNKGMDPRHSTMEKLRKAAAKARK